MKKVIGTGLGVIAVLLSALVMRGVHAAPFQTPPNTPSFVVGFDPTGLNATQQQLYQNMAGILGAFNVIPNARLTYYSAVNNANGYVIGGWGGTITSVQQNDNGYSVTLSVNPTLSSNSSAACVIMDADYSEVFQVNNDSTYSYVDSIDPQGLAGQLPANIAGL